MRSSPLRFLVPLILAALPCRAALIDSWDEAPRITVVHPLAADPFAAKDVADRKTPDYKNPRVVLRYDAAHDGAFGIEVDPAPGDGAVTFLAALWQAAVEAPAGASCEFWLAPGPAAKGAALPDRVPVTLTAADGTKTALVAQAGSHEKEWTLYKAPLAGAASVKAVTLDLSAALAGGPLLVDGAGFRAADRFVGLTDKPFEQWTAQIAATRTERVRSAFQAGTTSDFSGVYREYFDRLWIGREIPETNALMRKFLQDELDRLHSGHADLWDLALNIRLIETYYDLGSRSGRTPVPLEPATEKLLLQLLWERTQSDNDMGWAASDVWWLTGSENHDLNAKVSCLVSSRIFMDEPAYRDRLYPDAAHAPGYGYWFGQMYAGAGGGYGPDPMASWKPSGRHNAADHYHAWVAFFDRYITGRAERGFFLERAAPGYMKWTLDFLYTLHRYCGDASLKAKTGDFLTLAWADWAQEQIGGIRGGAKTRHHHTVGGTDSMTDMGRFLLGGPGSTNHIYTAMLLDDEAPLPPVVVSLALDSRSRGRYAIASRGIGEEEGVFPRPAGTERTLTVDRDARFLKYSWVTPDYILGTQMDHPAAVESHLSAAGRWHGLIVAGSPESRIVPTGGIEENPGTASHKVQIDMERMYQTAQDRNVLIVQQARRWAQVSPDWYPSTPMYDKPIVLHVGTGWDETAVRSGWLFFRRQAAYAAVRVLDGQKGDDKTNPLNLKPDVQVEGRPDLVRPVDQAWSWNADKTGLQLDDMFSPIVIYAGSAAEHGDFAAFQATVLRSRLELHTTVVPGFFTVVFQGGERDAREIDFSANTPGIPVIGGTPVEYQPADLFSGPFLQSRFRSGQARITDGTRELLLNFVGGAAAK